LKKELGKDFVFKNGGFNMIESAVAIKAVETGLKLKDVVSGIISGKRKEKDEAIQTTLEAILKTRAYLPKWEENNRNPTEESEIVELWRKASGKLKSVNSKLSVDTAVKALFWADTNKEVKRYVRKLDDIFEDIVALIDPESMTTSTDEILSILPK
jgi:hypothetical protein